MRLGGVGINDPPNQDGGVDAEVGVGVEDDRADRLGTAGGSVCGIDA